MIDKLSLTRDWILSKKKEFPGSDPSIIERTVFALYLVEQLCLTGLDFVFKGGTSLLLLLEDPKRFSIDVDIVLPKDYDRSDLDEKFSRVLADGVFIRVTLDEKRSLANRIPKAHYRFVFTSVLVEKEQEILLDILFEDPLYPGLSRKPVEAPWILQKGPAVEVVVPDIESILGDKLTAFAPNTTGVPYRKNKEREIIKQLFDIGVLFDQIKDLEKVKLSFTAFASAEIEYRSEKRISPTDVLDDIINTGLILARRGDEEDQQQREDFAELQEGIRQFQYFQFSGTFKIEHAQAASAKAAYLAAMIRTDYHGEIAKFQDETILNKPTILIPEYNFLNKKLKYVPDGALSHWNLTTGLLYGIR
jgi:hypothetical protein